MRQSENYVCVAWHVVKYRVGFHKPKFTPVLTRIYNAVCGIQPIRVAFIPLSIGHVRYIILTWLRGFRVKIVIFLSFLSLN